ncbi:PIN domain-containing protein [Patescibacteria group bacterium]|nr:PIN domain-containing protein [Patescibacteria group bacterium]
MKYFVDSNIFLRTLEKEDEKTFSECYGILKLVREGGIKAITSHIVLAEIVWVLGSFYKKPRKDITQALNGIENLRGLKLIDRFDSNLALKFYSEYKVKYINALIASIPEVRDKNWAVVSYDRDFDRLGVERKDPGQVVKSKV